VLKRETDTIKETCVNWPDEFSCRTAEIWFVCCSAIASNAMLWFSLTLEFSMSNSSYKALQWWKDEADLKKNSFSHIETLRRIANIYFFIRNDLVRLTVIHTKNSSWKSTDWMKSIGN